ncbi:MAG: discoidin domain-containing protein [Lentisphaeria bacterium]|nr:discoidin domain-containing protein [Lentisphaeria bacterium]
MRYVLLIALLAFTLCAQGAPVKIVCLGDSITRGVRGGVTARQTYEHHLQQWLGEHVTPVEVINKGIGGERTDQALKRLASDIITQRPDIVTVMYGTNDSAIDAGKTEPRLPLARYEANLHTIVARLRAAGIRPVLMTSPPLCPKFVYRKREPYVTKGVNHQLVRYVRRVPLVAAKEHVALVDNFAKWAELALLGQDLNALTTDGCHPNPDGHLFIARTMYPVLALLLGGDPELPKSTRATLPAPARATPPPVQTQEGNLALHKPYTQTDPNTHGYDRGLTDGIIDNDTKAGVFASGTGLIYPKVVTIDLGAVQTVGRIVLRNAKDGSTKSVIVHVSSDGQDFENTGTHMFEKMDAAVKTFTFAPKQSRYVRLTFVDTWGNKTHGSPDFMFLRELEVYAK